MEEIIGQRLWQAFFSKAIAADTLHHAYLFVGPSGVGKRTFITRVASAILGSSAATHPDYIELANNETESLIGIVQVRQFIATMASSPIVGRYRIAVVPCFERLNMQGYNALLKTLEEPPRHIILLLAAQSVDQLPATVRSRLQICAFTVTPRAELAHALVSRGASLPQAEILAAAALGRPGLALWWLEKPEAFAAHQAQMQHFIALLRKPLPVRFAFTETVAKEAQCPRLELERLLGHWQILLRDVALLLCNQPGFVANRFAIDELRSISEVTTMGSCLTATRALELARERIRTYANRRLALNTFFMSL